MDAATHGQALRIYPTIAAMIGDPDCSGELLALGVALVHACHTAVCGTRLATATAHASGRAGDEQWRWLWRVMRKDLPRYESGWLHASHTCGGPAPRGPGACGRRTVHGFIERDQATGEHIGHAFCQRHWEAFGAALFREVNARPTAPQPKANRGGVLARHLPEWLDWPELWRWCEPSWTMPPGGLPAPSLVAQRPALRLISSDEVAALPVLDGVVPGASQRAADAPRLRLVPVGAG